MVVAPPRPEYMNAPLPADAEFVARVRREIADADVRAYQALGRHKPKPEPEPEPLPPPAPAPPPVKVTPKVKQTPKPKTTGKRAEQAAARALVREEVLFCLMCGQTQKETALSLGLPASTVANHLEVLRAEYGARNVHHLAALGTIKLMEQMVETREKLIGEYEFRERLRGSE